MNKKYFLTLTALVLASCSDNSTFTEKESPNLAYKDYKGHEKSIIGVGKTISARKSEANSTISFKSKYSLDKAIVKFANRYDLSVEWDEEVNRFQEQRLTANRQTFNEARAYLEDVYDVSIIRKRGRAIQVMIPATVNKLESFNPGPNVRLSDAVNGLAGLCGINLVIADYKQVLATEKITTNLKDISCNQAFEAILDPFGLSLKQRGSHYTIAGLPYKEWNLNLHEQKREETQKVNYSSEFSGGSGEDDSGAGLSGGSSTTTSSYSRDLWKSLEGDLKELLSQSCKSSKGMGYNSTEEVSQTVDPMGVTESGGVTVTAGSAPAEESCGYVRVNPDVGVVQMQANRRVIEKADDLITTLEDIASRRLLVEARILAVAKERTFDRGSDINIAGNLGSTDFSLGYQPATILKEGASVAGTLNDLLTTSGGGMGFKAGDLDAVVRYVQSFGTTYQLMKPTLEVMDRQKSTLIDGRNERYFIRSASVDSSGENPVVTTEAEERYQFSGIQFSVSAQIAEDDSDLHTVALQIPITEISKTVILENRAGEDKLGNPVFIKDEIPVATTRVIDQKVRVRDGEIKVIGGLTKTIAVDKETGVPLLQDVPVAGNAFSEESVTYEDVEFVVLLQVKRLD
ncbi:MAG TPA: hypothetical protein DCL21_02405 [Alphaproteobacteria bacterium]|nr:hypothetical protein [Alphaproteobacteria bacterium]